MNIQNTHESSKFTTRQSNVVLICDGVSSPANIGGLFRIADAFGVKEIIFCHAEIDINSSRLKRTARNTERTSNFRISETDTLVEITSLREAKYTTIALEITSQSTNIKELVFQNDQNIALIIGNERHGVSPEVLKQVDICSHIAMHGKNSSMNVVQACAIALYTLS